MKPQLRDVNTEYQDDEEEAAAQALEKAFADLNLVTEKISRVKRLLAVTNKLLENTDAEESELQAKLVTTNAAYDTTVAKAARERDAIVADLTIQIKDLADCRSVLAMSKGKLTELELP